MDSVTVKLDSSQLQVLPANRTLGACEIAEATGLCCIYMSSLGPSAQIPLSVPETHSRSYYRRLTTILTCNETAHPRQPSIIPPHSSPAVTCRSHEFS